MQQRVASSGKKAHPTDRSAKATTLHQSGSRSTRPRPKLSRDLKTIFAEASKLSKGCLIQAHLLVLGHSRTVLVPSSSPLYEFHRLVRGCDSFRQEKVAYFTQLLQCSPVDLFNHEADARGELGNKRFIFERMSKALAFTA
jgi:hypothetical protein